MVNTKRFLRFLNFFQFRSVLKNNGYRKEFYAEIGLINFQRLRNFSYFLLVFISSQLYNDFFNGDFWEERQVSSFMLLDIIMGVIAVLVFGVTHIRAPRIKKHIKKWHHVVIYTFIFLQINWAVAISLIDISSVNGTLTYSFGVFAAATIFLLRSIPFISILLISLVFFYSGLIENNIPTEQIVAQYIQIPGLVVVAWVVSRVLMNTRMRFFTAHKEVKIARDNLDQTVKERTIELEKANTQLREEIRERKKYEQGLKREKKKAEEADKLKSVFLANMSHEIRTPLNGILGFGDLLETPGLAPAKQKRYIDIIRNNGQQLLKIIDDIMDISMIESNQLKINRMPFRIQFMFPQAQDFFTNLKNTSDKQHLNLINDDFIELEGEKFESDPVRVQQILYNLLSNAIKFTQEGNVHFGGAHKGNFALIYVEDTGIGVDPKQCKSIFERFRQGQESTSREYGGTGLGLSISKGIIELLSGLLWLDLSYTGGARFCVSIPTNNKKENDGNVLLKNLTDIKDNFLVLVQNDEHPVFMDFFLETMNINSCKSTASNYLQLPNDFYNTEILLVDLTNIQDESVPEDIVKIMKRNSSTRTLALINESENLRMELSDLGCSAIYSSRINALELFSSIYKYTALNVQLV